jgi:hypothetical protein
MSESMNLASVVASVVQGHDLPRELCALAVFAAAGVLIALGLSRPGRSGG